MYTHTLKWNTTFHQLRRPFHVLIQTCRHYHPIKLYSHFPTWELWGEIPSLSVCQRNLNTFHASTTMSAFTIQHCSRYHEEPRNSSLLLLSSHRRQLDKNATNPSSLLQQPRTERFLALESHASWQRNERWSWVRVMTSSVKLLRPSSGSVGYINELWFMNVARKYGKRDFAPTLITPSSFDGEIVYRIVYVRSLVFSIRCRCASMRCPFF